MAQPTIPPTYQHKLYVLEDSALTALSQIERFTKEFPFLRSLKKAPKKKGCSSCGSNNIVRSDTFSAVKQAIASMSSDSKRKLKNMLNAKEARVTYRDNSGKIVQRTF